MRGVTLLTLPSGIMIRGTSFTVALSVGAGPPAILKLGTLPPADPPIVINGLVGSITPLRTLLVSS